MNPTGKIFAAAVLAAVSRVGNEVMMLHAAMQIAATCLVLMNPSMQHLKLALAADFSLVPALHGHAP